MPRKLQTIDLEFNEWCNDLLMDGMDPMDYLRILGQYSFIWEACRRRCADLCVQNGSVDMATDIMRNQDGIVAKDWKGE